MKKKKKVSKQAFCMVLHPNFTLKQDFFFEHVFFGIEELEKWHLSTPFCIKFKKDPFLETDTF